MLFEVFAMAVWSLEERTINSLVSLIWKTGISLYVVMGARMCELGRALQHSVGNGG